MIASFQMNNGNSSIFSRLKRDVFLVLGITLLAKVVGMLLKI